MGSGKWEIEIRFGVISHFPFSISHLILRYLYSVPLSIHENTLLAPYTTFQVGGPARWFCAPSSRTDFAEAREFARTRGISTFVLGKGSNLVVSDAGYPGLVVYTGEFNRISWEGARATAECGALLWDVVNQSVERGFRGMQNMAGIPGTLGGGTYINAGAFDQELKDVVTEVVSMPGPASGGSALVTRDNAACRFAYRRSLFGEADEWILETTMELQPDGASPEAVATLRAERDAIVERRVARQPLHLPNAGSMFKRPPGNYAGALIEAAGLKGFRLGGAGISDKHANFTVNNGGATAQDIWDLTSEVILRVHAHSGITLEREPIFVGEFLSWPRGETQR
jgi:UDP-N-acetylmuramate dehydrogenase